MDDEHPDGPLGELRDHLKASRQHLDQIARALRDTGGPGVLELATVTIPAAGYLERSYKLPYAAVAVLNFSASPVTVTSAAAQGAVPGGGQGQMQVPATAFVALNMSGQTVTFYGIAGAVITYNILTSRIQPAAARLA